MKILIVTFHFPPANTIAAVRLGKLAKWLYGQGHDVRVVAANNPEASNNLPLDFPTERVNYTDWYDINRLPKAISAKLRALWKNLKRQPADTQDRYAPLPPTIPHSTRFSCGQVFQHVTNWPDRHIGWLPFVVCNKTLRGLKWLPDVVYASGPPMTTLLVGYLLARRYRAPLVAEFRDRWVGDPYSNLPGWRKSIDRIAERILLQRTAGVVTVSEPWAEEYRAKFDGPVEVVSNGYDPSDFLDDHAIGALSDETLHIVYMGGIYPGRRDPTPLFRAVERLKLEDPAISIDFYGTNELLVQALATDCDVKEFVKVYPRVSYAESIAIQRSTDVLLLMDYNDPQDYGSIPGKLFEYLAARRPILGTGLENGLSAQMIRERSAGLFSNDPYGIAQQLRQWLAIKKRDGHIPALSHDVCAGLSRDEQYSILDSFIQRITPA